MKIPEPTEHIEFDIPDDASELAPPDPGPFHTLLEVWRAILEPAVSGEMRKDPITPQWATKMVTTYPGIGFADVDAVHHGVFDRACDMAMLLDAEISSDEECLKQPGPIEDRLANSEHYRNMLASWQVYLLNVEMSWRPSDADAAVKLAVLSEVQQMFLGQAGLVAHLDSIGFQFTEEDQAELAEILVGARQFALDTGGENE